VRAIAHEENVVQWAEAIVQSLQDAPEPAVLFPQLCLVLKIPWLEVWMGVLFSVFELQQQGEFYQADIWVKHSVK
jgi:hypothetical protein